MANEIRVTDLGAYVERSGVSVDITDVGIYIESVEFTNEVDVTQVGAYIELSGNSVDITDVGVYVETVDPYIKFVIYFDSYRLCEITSIKIGMTVSSAKTDTLLDISGNKIPIIPTWQVDVKGFWCKELAEKLGGLTDQDGDILAIFVTDRQNNTIMLSNTESFVTSFVTDSNIDNVLVYSLSFVGSGNLLTSSVI